MKWSREYVWSKVLELTPYAKEASMNLPEALKSSAIELFLLDEGHHNGSYRAYVITEALKELRDVGHFTFGDVNEDWR